MNETNIKNRKFRFSVADLIIILLLIACAVGITMRYNIVEKLFGRIDEKEMKIAFVAENLNDYEVAALSENTVFFLDGEIFGKVDSVASSPSIIYYENSVGVLSSYESKDRYDAAGTFTGSLSVTEKGHFLNGETFIAPGSVLTIKSSGVSLSVTVTEITDAE